MDEINNKSLGAFGRLRGSLVTEPQADYKNSNISNTKAPLKTQTQQHKKGEEKTANAERVHSATC